MGYGVDYSPNAAGDLTSGISLMGKNAIMPENVRVGRNCVVAGDSRPEDFVGNMVPSGTTVGYAPKG
jgi:glucose-1-phosphate adenylyltransferase